jgi:alpha-mannosidase
MYFDTRRIKKLIEALETGRYTHRAAFGGWKISPGKPQDSGDAGNWREFGADERWGGFEIQERHAWFRCDVTIPEALDGKEVILHVKTGAECGWDLANPQLLAYVNGRLVQGLDIRHRDIALTGNARAGEVIQLALFAYCGINGGLAELLTELSGLDRDTEGLYYDCKTLLDVAELLDENDMRRVDVVNALTGAVNLLDLRKPNSPEYAASILAARDYLAREYFGKHCGESGVTVSCVGHTHIDVAWLWTLAQTREKVVRSFSTVLNLMKQYPEYRFMSSQPQLYEYLKEEAPELYAEVKERVREGRWEPEGALWVEADCNVTGGESLIRQIIFGKRFFREEFGVESEIAWLPDTFGFSAAIPQILKKTGVKYFLASKLGWNEYHEMPCDSFHWRGIDGSEVLAQFITAQSPTFMPTAHAVSYNGRIDAPHLISAWKKYRQKALHDEVIMAYGYGDGGGGPTKDMLEAQRRFSKGIPGCPVTKQGKAIDFFHNLEKASNNNRFPTWVGELYLEGCRGTYTSMARVKRNNRKNELLYQAAELWSAAANRLTGLPYPQEELKSGWKKLLLNQFHDILPGTGIKEVYDDCDRDHADAREIGRKALHAAQRSIAGNVRLDRDSVIVFNPLCEVRNDVVFAKLPEGWDDALVYDGDIPVPSQRTAEGKLAFYAESVPSKGYKAFRIERGEAAEPAAMTAVADRLENSFFALRLDENAHLVSVYDKLGKREVIPEGMRGNVLQAFEDRPYHYDAWEISMYYEEHMWELNEVSGIKVIENGPVFARLRIVRAFSRSEITQDIVIYNDVPRIDFDTTVDWRETQIMLKAAFPVDIHAEKASYEVQYGAYERPTHRNTPWDAARFEVPAHKWADISEAGYGVSLLNDCKYGYDVRGNVMRLTLLKSPVDPYADADREIHRFTYSLYPHAGDWRESGTVSQAEALNCPMDGLYEPAHPGTLGDSFSLVSTDARNVRIAVVKQAEAGSEIILRVYEGEGKRTKASLTYPDGISAVWECDMLEKRLEPLSLSGNTFAFEIKPYEIKTFMLIHERD